MVKQEDSMQNCQDLQSFYLLQYLCMQKLLPRSPLFCHLLYCSIPESELSTVVLLFLNLPWRGGKREDHKSLAIYWSGMTKYYCWVISTFMFAVRPNHTLLTFKTWSSRSTSLSGFLVQHTYGHTLDLILTHGFSISDIEISSASFSDHLSVLFTVPLTGRTLKNPSLARLTRCLNQCSSEDFTTAYHDVRNSLESNSTLHNLDADAHLNLFNSTCSAIMNSIAPLKFKNHKPAPVPWHTDTTRTLRRVSGQAERQWKKDHLQVSYEILRNSLAE